MPTDGCQTEGCDITWAQENYDRERAYNLACEQGGGSNCSPVAQFIDQIPAVKTGGDLLGLIYEADKGKALQKLGYQLLSNVANGLFGATVGGDMEGISFAGIEGANAGQIRGMVPDDWSVAHNPYEITAEGPYKGTIVEQWKFTSPDGQQELRIHAADPRFGGSGFQARWGVQAPSDGPNGNMVGANPYNPSETWQYFGNAGQPVHFRSDEGHIALSTSLDELISVFGH